MSDYIYTSDGELYHADELCHYGVPGMKWGKRKARGHAGTGRYLTKKRQLAGDKKDLEYLNKGGHLSVGLTKKRQAAYDAKDKARLERRIAKNEQRLSTKSAKKAATKAAVKDYDKSFNTATKSQDKADRKWSDVQNQYKSLGKTRVTRALKATYGKSDAVKKYRREYDNWEKSQNAADKQWKDARKKYKKTGKTRAGRVVNNIRYGK